MVRVTKIMVVAFVSVLLFCNYTNDLVGRVAAAAASGVEEEARPTTHSWYDNDGGGSIIPVPTRKLRKKRKAAKEAKFSEDANGVLRLLVFATVMDLYRFSMLQQSPADVTPPRADTNGGRASGWVYDRGGGRLPPPNNDTVSATVSDWSSRLVFYSGNACDVCLAFSEVQMYAPNQEQEDFCQHVVAYLAGRLRFAYCVKCDPTYDILAYYCLEFLQCPLDTRNTPSMCCKSQGVCLD